MYVIHMTFEYTNCILYNLLLNYQCICKKLLDNVSDAIKKYILHPWKWPQFKNRKNNDTTEPVLNIGTFWTKITGQLLISLNLKCV